MNRKSIKQHIFCGLILVAALGIFSACQATPETAAVVARDGTEKAVLEAAKNPEAEILPYEVPEHVTQRFSVVEGVLDISIDADVEMTDIERFPVALAEADPFTQEKADRIRAYFLEEKKLFTQDVMTKADYDAEIVLAKRGYEVDGEHVFDEDSQRWVDELMEMREQAPDENTPVEITDFSIDGERLGGQIMLDGEQYGDLYISEDSISFYGMHSYWEADRTYYTGDDKKLTVTPCEIHMTEEEAVKTVEKVLSDLGIEGMGIKSMTKVYYIGREANLEEKPEYGGYSFVLMRTFGGMFPFAIEGYSMGPDDKFDVSPPISMEVIRMAINDSGEVEQFFWMSPAKITGTMAEHVDILPFEDILARFESFSKQQYAYVSEFGKTDGQIWVKKVHSIGLYLNYLPIKNNPSEFMFAPCWVFTYKDTQEYTPERLAELAAQGYDVMDDEMMGDEQVVFSAVDGASVSVYSSEELEEMMRWEEEMKEVEEKEAMGKE